MLRTDERSGVVALTRTTVESPRLLRFSAPASWLAALADPFLLYIPTAFIGFLRIYMTGNNEKVQPRVVIHIEESRAPLDIGVAGLAYARGPTGVIKAPRAQISEERIGLGLEVRRDHTETPGMVVVSPINSHVSEFHTLAAQRYTGNHRNVGESTIVIIVVEVVGAPSHWPPVSQASRRHK